MPNPTGNTRLWRSAALTLAAASLVVAGCAGPSSDTSNSSNSRPVSDGTANRADAPPPPPPAAQVPAALVGVWYMDAGAGLTLNSDGTYTYLTLDSNNHTGTFTVNGHRINFAPAGGDGSLRYPGQDRTKSWAIENGDLRLTDSQTDILLHR